MAQGNSIITYEEVEAGDFLDIRPSPQFEWEVHNLFYGAPMELYVSDGETDTLIDSDASAGARLCVQLHPTSAFFFRMKNVGTSAAMFGFDGVVTKRRYTDAYLDYIGIVVYPTCVLPERPGVLLKEIAVEIDDTFPLENGQTLPTSGTEPYFLHGGAWLTDIVDLDTLLPQTSLPSAESGFFTLWMRELFEERCRDETMKDASVRPIWIHPQYPSKITYRPGPPV